MKMVDRKGGQKLNIVDRKFIMTVKVTAKMTPKRQRMILKVKEMTLKKQKMTPRMFVFAPGLLSFGLCKCGVFFRIFSLYCTLFYNFVERY